MQESILPSEFTTSRRFNPYTEMVINSWQQLEIGRDNHCVAIDSGRLNEIANLHYQDQWEVPSWRFEGVYPKDNLAFASSVLIHNTINAAYNFPTGEKYAVPFEEGKPLIGAFGMVRKFYERFGENIITTSQLNETFGSKEQTKIFLAA